MAEVNDRPYDRRLFDRLSGRVWSFGHGAGEVERSFGVVLPEVDSIAEPIVVIAAGIQCGLTREYPFGKLSLTSVVAKDERW